MFKNKLSLLLRPSLQLLTQTTFLHQFMDLHIHFSFFSDGYSQQINPQTVLLHIIPTKKYYRVVYVRFIYSSEIEGMYCRSSLLWLT